MAGFYADVPGARMAYDADGSSALYVTSGGSITTLTATQARQLNNENDDGPGLAVSATDRVVILFPELRDVVGVYVDINATSTTTLEKSSNTTNGFDGTWTVVNSSFPVQSSAPVGPYYRTAIQSVSMTGVKGVRIAGRGTGSAIDVLAFHLYGTIASGQTPDRLRLWHPTFDQPLSDTPAYLDLGDAAQGSTITKLFRVKNNSSSQTAQGVALAFNILTDASPTLVGQFQMSYNGGSYGNTTTIGNLSPGTISQQVSLRKITSSTAGLGLDAVRIVPSVTGWV